MAKTPAKKKTRKAKTPAKFNPGELEEVQDDPRRVLFANAYLTIGSKTFGNVKRSALAAGFSQIYSKNLTAVCPDWLVAIRGQFRKSQMFQQAKKNLEHDLAADIYIPVIGRNGPVIDKATNKPIKVRDTDAWKLKQNATFKVLDAFDPEFAPKQKDPAFDPSSMNVQFVFQMGKDETISVKPNDNEDDKIEIPINDSPE